MRVVIASHNPVKARAVREGFQAMFPDHAFEFLCVSVPSHVADQPSSDEETFRGAKNRADGAFGLGADYAVGIEGGIARAGEEMEAFAWVVIASSRTYGKARSATFLLPRDVASLIDAGKELGEAIDTVFARTNSKQGAGAVGQLTGDVIDRTSYYAHAVILALIAFKNPRMYGA